MKHISRVLLIALFFSFVPAPAQAVTLSDYEMTAVVQIISWNEGGEYDYYGTGFMVDFVSGCFVTATHVVADDEGYWRDYNLAVFQSGTSEEELYWADPIIGYTDADVTYMCINDEEYVDQFRHFFPFGLDTFQDMQVGDSLTGMGYPSVGGDSITATFGQVTGFAAYVGDRDLIKSDMDVSGGISGGPVIADNKDIVGMIIAYTEEEGNQVSYSVSADLLNYVDELATEEIRQALIDSGVIEIDESCVYDDDAGWYTLDDELYYDAYCEVKVDILKEEVLAEQYTYWCGVDADTAYLYSASVAINSENYDLGYEDWKTYLGTLCGEIDSSDPYNFYTPDQQLALRLIKSDASSAVYAVLNDGKRHAFANQHIYASWYGEDYSTVETVTAEELASYSLGSNITFHPGTLIKIPSIPNVYLVSDDNELRWVSDESTAEALYGTDWSSQIYDVAETLFTNYETGEDIVL